MALDSTYEFEFLAVGDQAGGIGAPQKAPDGFAAAFSIVQSPMVYIHADEFVGEVPAHIAGVLESVLNGFLPMIEAVLDAGGKDLRDFFPEARFKPLMNHVASKWEWKPIIFAPPPNAEVFTNLEPFILIGELAFMND